MIDLSVYKTNIIENNCSRGLFQSKLTNKNISDIIKEGINYNNNYQNLFQKVCDEFNPISYNNSSKQIRIVQFHQPLFFGPSYIAGQLYFLEYLARKLNSNNIPNSINYVLVDYDTVSEDGYYNTNLSDPFSKTGSVLLTAGKQTPSELLIKFSGLLHPSQKDKIDDVIVPWLKSIRRFKGIFKYHFGWDIVNSESEFRSQLKVLFANSKTLFSLNYNIILLLKKILRCDNINIVSGYDYFNNNNRHIKNFLTHMNTKEFCRLIEEATSTITDSLGRLTTFNPLPYENWLPYWAFCEKCKQRIPLFLNIYIAKGCCGYCEKKFNYDTRYFNDYKDKFFPKAILQNILLTNELGNDFYFNHIGASEYTLISNYITSKIYGNEHKFPILYKNVPIFLSPIHYALCIGKNQNQEGIDYNMFKSIFISGKTSTLEMIFSYIIGGISDINYNHDMTVNDFIDLLPRNIKDEYLIDYTNFLFN